MGKDNLKVKDEMSLQAGKMFNEGVFVKVNMRLQLFDHEGRLKTEQFVHNTVTTAGKNDIANQMLAAPTAAKYGWMAVGTGTPTATLLGAEVARVAFDSKTAPAAIVTTIATFPAGTGTGALTEAGTFNIVTANTADMWMSASFSVINKGASDSLVITWTLTFA